jgi:hypothetical protein
VLLAVTIAVLPTIKHLETLTETLAMIYPPWKARPAELEEAIRLMNEARTILFEYYKKTK